MNKSVKKKLKSYITVSVVVFSFIGIILASIVIERIPFKSYGDIWFHIAAVEELQSPYDEIGDPFFNEGIKDLHYGPYTVVTAFLVNQTSRNIVTVMIALGVASVVFLCVSIIHLYLTFFPARKKILIDKIVVILFFFLLWDSGRISYAGYFSLFDIVVTIPFPHLFALAVFNYGISYSIKMWEHLSKKENVGDTRSLVFFMLILITIGAFLILTHVITGVMFLYVFAITGLAYVFMKKLDIKTVLGVGLTVGVTILVIVPFWKYYDFWAPIVAMQTIHVDSPLVSIFDVRNWVEVAGVALLGIIALAYSRKVVLWLWFVCVFFITISYLFPIRISSYWRFFPVLLIPLYLALTYWISSMDRSIRTFLILLILFFGTFSFVNKSNTIRHRVPIEPDRFEFLEVVDNDVLILSDPETSYLLSGLSGNPVLATTETHWGVANEEVSYVRYNDSLSFWGNGENMGSEYILDEYGVSYILFNKKIIKGFARYLLDLSSDYSVQVIYEDDVYLLVHVINL